MYVCGVWIDDAVAQQAMASADAHGAPRGAIVGMGIIECGGDPNVPPHTDWNGLASVGFLQLNQGGQGYGYSVAYLQNFANNLAIGVPHIAAAWRDYASSSLWTKMQASGHPGWTNDPALISLWTEQRPPHLNGYTPLSFLQCAIDQLAAAPPPPPPPPPPPNPPTGPGPAAPATPRSGNIETVAAVTFVLAAGYFGYQMAQRSNAGGSIQSRMTP